MKQTGDGDFIAQASSYLQAGINVELRGLPGSGRSYVFDGVVDVLRQRQIPVFSLRAVALPGGQGNAAMLLRNKDGEQTSITLPTLLESIHPSALSGTAVVAIDDIDNLDVRVAGAIAGAASQATIPFMLVTRPTTAPLTNVLSTYLQPRARIIMEPFSHEEMDHLLRTHSDMILELATLGVITGECGGLPGLGLRMTSALRSRGLLTKVGAAWRLAANWWTPDLAGLVDPYLSPLTPSMTTALHALVAGSGLTPTQARSTPWWNDMKALEHIGLLHTLDVLGQQELAAYPPLLAEYFRHEGSVLALHEITNFLAGDDSSTVATHPVVDTPSRGNSQERDIILRAHRMRAYWKQEAVDRRFLWLADPSPWNAMRYLTALGHIPTNRVVIEEVVAQTQTSESGLAQTLFFTWWTSYLALALKEPRRAQDLLRQLREQFPESAGAMRALEAHILLITEAVPSSELLAPPMPDEHPLSEELVRAVNAEVYVARGLQRHALQTLDTEGESAVGVTTPASVARGMAMLLDGDVDGALAWALKNYSASLDSLDIAWSSGHAYLVALGYAMSGRLDTFDKHMSTITAATSIDSLNVHYLGAALSFAAFIAADRGQHESAMVYAEQAVDLDLPDDIYPGIPSHVAHVLVAGDREATSEALWKATLQRREADYLTSAVMVGIIALEYDPDPAHALIVGDIAESTESPLLRTVAKYGAALTTRDPEQLFQAAKDLAEIGMLLYAVRSATGAAKIYYQSEKKVEGRQVLTWIWTQLQPMDTSLHYLLLPAIRAIGVTERELQIIALLATNLTSPEIADILVVSTRTVEQHVFRTNRKFGTHTRQELIELATSWLSPFLPSPLVPPRREFERIEE